MKAEIEWVNQKERKPNDDVPVMIITNQKELWLGEYSRLRNKGNGGWAIVYDGAPPFDSENITHWAYYPKLP